MKLVTLISFLYFSYASSLFIRYPFGPKFSIKDKEVNKKIEYELPLEKQRIINKINGLYALIGPDVNMKEVSTLFDLFIGDGIIQSVFFNKGELTYVKHYVRTEKLLYEEENGIIPKNALLQLLFVLLNKLGLFPNTLGLANTAILNIKNKAYALYERDSPYLLDVDFTNSQISTVKKMDICNMNYFSAHSKYEATIDTIEYNMLFNNVKYHELTQYFETITNKVIKMDYLPVVHDFLKTEDKIIITDSPLVIDFSNLFSKSMPVMLDNKKKTIINVLNKSSMTIDKYYVDEGFYIFHYADYRETDKYIEIYASIYNNLDFSELNIVGKYRKLILEKDTKQVTIEKNPELEKLDLEFPVKFDDKIILRNINNRRITGFVVCKGLEIIKNIEFGNKFISGEPVITYIDNIPYLIGFAFDNEKSNNGFLIIIDMNTYEIIEIPINETISIGFHSTFISNQ
jgi:carotenoid cleavage dioxygenase-like enzyme